MTALRILIAEDVEVVRHGIRSILGKPSNWKICGEAATGAETIEKARALNPDLLLLDVTMPDMEAAAVIPGVIQFCPAIKIVALAMEGAAKPAANALAAGADGLALKSEPARDLILTLKNVQNDQSYLSPGAVTMIRSHLASLGLPSPTPNDLSPRELEIFRSLARGDGNKELAGRLGISVKTVNAHRSSIMRKLKLRSYSDLIQFAIRHRIVEIQREHVGAAAGRRS